MSTEVCCVCQRPLDSSSHVLGGRAYCEHHYRQVTGDRRGLWMASLGLILGLVVFVLAVFILAPYLGAITPAGLITAGVVLALVPALVWLLVFYLQDRIEPEPKSYVLKVFVLGALLASAVGQPVVRDFFRVNEWAGQSLVLKLAAAILIVGIVQEFLKYAAVRYSVFQSSEFDERIDGIVYGAAAGLGYATMLNLVYVIGNGGVDLGFGAVRIAVTALAHASFAGVTGYFLGRAKFENRGPFWLPGGILLAALLNGVVSVALGEIGRSGLQVTPVRGLLVAAVVAALTFGLLFVVMRRSTQTALAAGA